MNAILFTTLVVCVPAPKDRDAPVVSLGSARVGDWVEYRMTTQTEDNKFETVFRKEVTAKTAIEVMFKITLIGLGAGAPPQEFKIDLRQENNPALIPGLRAGGDFVMEKIGEGKERVKISMSGTNVEYECRWQSQKIRAKARGEDGAVYQTIWKSNDALLDGTIRSEYTTAPGQMKVTKTVLELVNQGRR